MLKEKGFPVEKENVLRSRCIKFVTTLAQEMRRRLPNNMTIPQNISLFSVHHALNCIKEPLTPLLELLKVPPDDIGIIENQWRNLTLVKWNEVTKTDLL